MLYIRCNGYKKQPVDYLASTIFRAEENIHPKDGGKTFLHKVSNSLRLHNVLPHKTTA
jgi:hypothetical protein